MPEILQIIIHQNTFLGQIVGYRKPGDDKNIYWLLKTPQDQSYSFHQLSEANPLEIPVDVLQEFKDKYLRSKGL